MISVLNEISKLRNTYEPLKVDLNNTNRYRVVLNETDGTKTAYYFSTPIYNKKTGKLVEMEFVKENDEILFLGSNSKTVFCENNKNANLISSEGICTIYLKDNPKFSNEKLYCKNDIIKPTLNGFLYKAKIENNMSFSFKAEVFKQNFGIMFNNKFFSVMSKEFCPFVTISAIGAADEKGNITAPVNMDCKNITEHLFEFTFNINQDILNAEYIVFEVNMYESKLVQDTTVESNNPNINNVYGSTAFIGETENFGEQWLYSKFEYAFFSDISSKKILKAVAHIPKYSNSSNLITAYKASNRFCSFASNWNNKIADSGMAAQSDIKNQYYNFDLTDLIVEKNGFLKYTDGIIFKLQQKNNGFSVISTGDSYFAPYIYEFNYY